MIYRLKGKVWEVSERHLTVEVNGLGYGLGVPDFIATKYSEGDDISLYTYLHVREEAMDLYGFETRAERATFLLLLSVSGVGPKVALNILSHLPLAEIEQALVQAKPEYFQQISGVGRKLAERLIVELKGKIVTLPGDDLVILGESELAALQQLGYTAREAKEALRQLPTELNGASLETRLRAALRLLSKV